MLATMTKSPGCSLRWQNPSFMVFLKLDKGCAKVHVKEPNEVPFLHALCIMARVCGVSGSITSHALHY